jgi:hypothetical protein
MFAAWTRIRSGFRSLAPSWKESLLSGLAARIVLGIWAAIFFIRHLIPPESSLSSDFYFTVTPLLHGLDGALLGMWQRWDGIHYQVIAESGYNQIESVYFPAYPFLARTLSQVTGLPVMVFLLFISALAAFFCLVLIYQITSSLLPQPSAPRQAMLGLLLFPTSFFLFAAYPQSLALLWILLAYQQAQHQHWLAASLAGLLAGLTHGTVVPLAAMLAVQAIQVLRGQKFSLRWPALLSVPIMPLLGLGIFLAWRERMGYLILSPAQYQWPRVFSFPWDTLWADVLYLFNHMPPEWFALFNAALLILAVIASIWGLRHLPLALNVYQLGLLIFILSSRVMGTDPLISFNRLILIQFPFFIAVGALPLNAFRSRALITGALTACLFVSALFFMWHWVG